MYGADLCSAPLARGARIETRCVTGGFPAIAVAPLLREGRGLKLASTRSVRRSLGVAPLLREGRGLKHGERLGTSAERAGSAPLARGARIETHRGLADHGHRRRSAPLARGARIETCHPARRKRSPLVAPLLREGRGLKQSSANVRDLLSGSAPLARGARIETHRGLADHGHRRRSAPLARGARIETCHPARRKRSPLVAPLLREGRGLKQSSANVRDLLSGSAPLARGARIETPLELATYLEVLGSAPLARGARIETF